MSDRSAFPDPMEIWNHLELHVRGQEHAKREISVAVYNHYLNHHLFKDSRPQGQHLLLAGPEGVGKTFLVQKTAEFLGVPWVQVDASSLVQPAMAGQALQGITDALLHRAGGDLNLAQHGIVLIDRLDHCLRTSSSPGDPGLAVQEALMTLMDGVILQNKEEPQNRLDTSRLLFICCGAFPWIQAAVEERLEEGSRIGFQIDEESESTTHIRDLIQKSDLVTLGLSDELASRFNKVSLLNPLGTSDFVHLLKEMQNGILSQKITFWKAHGIDLKFTEAALEAIAEQAQAMGDGARALNGLIEKILDPIDHRIAELARKGVQEIEYDRSHIENGSLPQITQSDSTSSLEPLLQSVWAGFQAEEAQQPDSVIPIEPSIMAMPIANAGAALEQLELSMGRLALTAEQDKTWRAIRRKYVGEGQRVLLQLLARAQQAGVSLSFLCEAIQQSEGDLLLALKKIEGSQR